jgi:L-threonylcarbamoyladenylate synthase
MIDQSKDIERAIETMNNGGTILYLTDTIWGIGCDATNDKAVEKVYKLKLRPQNKSMIVLLDSEEKLKMYLKHVPEIALSLMKQVDTPLTIVYSQSENLAKGVHAADGSVAIRVVKDEFCKELCKQFNKPLISTSANISGYGNPLVFRGIDKKLVQNVDYVMEYGRNIMRDIKPST